MSAPLERFTRLVIRFPVATLVLAGIAAAASVWLTTTQLGFRTSRGELLSPNSQYNRRWLAYTKEFGSKEDAVVVVEGESREQIIPALDDVCRELAARKDLFGAVLHQTDAPKLRSKGLYYLDIESPDAKELDLAKIDALLNRAAPILQGDWATLSLGNMTQRMGSAMGGASESQRREILAAMQSELPRLIEGFKTAIGQPDARGPSAATTTGDASRGADSASRGNCRVGASAAFPWPEMPLSKSLAAQSGATRLISSDGRTGFILLRLLEEDKQSFAQNDESIKVLRQLTADVRSRHVGTKIGLTGLPIIEHDEMQSSEKSMSAATFLSFAGVLAVIIVAFGGFRHGVMAMAALLVGMIWACGCVALTIGHVNVLSIAFGSILFGLGIDYGIYYVARYLQLRRDTESTADALAATVASTGPGVLTGALTSAIAFFAAGFTEFPGVAQLGLIAGGGVLLCWLAQTTVLPAMIRLVDADGVMKNLPEPLNLRFWLRPLFAYPRLTLLAAVACTAATAVGVHYLWYDYNLLNLQPAGLESVDLEHKLFQQTNHSAWFALSIADTPQEVLAKRREFLKLASVERVEDVVSKLPCDCERKQPLIESIHCKLANLPQETPLIPVTPLADLDRMLAGAQTMLLSMPEAAQATDSLRRLRELLRSVSPEEYERRVRAYQQGMAADILGRLRTLQAASTPELPRVSDLPESVVSRFVGKSGRYLMKVYSKANIWEVGPMGQFVKDMRAVDAEATGNPLQVYEASWQMKRSFEEAACYALLMIVPTVLLDFRRLNHTLLAALPMAVGLLQTLGLMGLLDIPLNPANMIVLPLTLGIGMESGINLLHELRCQRGRYRGPGNAVMVAVVVNSLTTMVGFGALMIADHQGLQSLGRVLTISMGCCLLCSLLLPNLLVLGGFKNEDEEEADSDDDEAGDEGDDERTSEESSVSYAA
jgi:hopanoid biosynthesis associated RND transporter like protein HpnN